MVPKNHHQTKHTRKSPPWNVSPVAPRNGTSSLVHSSETSVSILSETDPTPPRCSRARLGPGSASPFTRVCWVCLARNHNRSGSIPAPGGKKVLPFSCFLRVTRGDTVTEHTIPLKGPPPRAEAGGGLATGARGRVTGCHLSLLRVTWEETQGDCTCPRSRKEQCKSSPPPHVPPLDLGRVACFSH